MYHINHEGKVYPCKAKVNKCSYGDGRHASTREELYYKLMKMTNDVSPAEGIGREIYRFGRIRSLWCIDSEIISHKSPVELIVYTLHRAITRTKELTVEDTKKKYDSIVRRGGEAVYEALKYGLSVPKIVPEEIKNQGYKLFYERLKGVPMEYAGSSRNPDGLAKRRYILEMEEEFKEYEDYKKWGITEENRDRAIAWMERDFYQFSHDLNTSKMITQPVFYGNLEKARETIHNMNDFELLSAYDDYLLTERDVVENVELANDFDYEPRNDLSSKANAKLGVWYNMNKAILQDWKKHARKRVVLSIEMANELDRRKIVRQDNAIGRIKHRHGL